MTVLNRRRMVVALAGLPILRLGPEIKPTPRALEPSDDDGPVSWQELADDLANMERRGIEDAHPRTWDGLHYDDLIVWSDGVLLLFGFGTARESDAKVESHIEWLDSVGIEIYAVGSSEDFRAWSMFVRAHLTGQWHGRTPQGWKGLVPA